MCYCTIFALFYFVLLCICVQLFPSISLRGFLFEGAIYWGFFGLQVWGACIWRGLYIEGLIFGIFTACMF